MLFITNHALNQSRKSKKGRLITFNPKDSEALQSVYFCERGDSGIIKEIGNEEFFKRLRETKRPHILLYAHGFNNQPDEVFERTEIIQKLADDQASGQVEVVPLIWPCGDGQGILKDYWDDQRSADASAYAFSRVLHKFNKFREKAEDKDEDVCVKWINILAHSMGNRVLRETLRLWHHDFGSVELLFRNVFMVAADVVNETLERGEAGHLICEAARNVAVYYAGDDLTLRASKGSNLRHRTVSRRLGHTGPEDMAMVPRNVYAIDCDSVNSLYDPTWGHSYFLENKAGFPGKVLVHILNAVISGRMFEDFRGSRSWRIEP